MVTIGEPPAFSQQSAESTDKEEKDNNKDKGNEHPVRVYHGIILH